MMGIRQGNTIKVKQVRSCSTTTDLEDKTFCGLYKQASIVLAFLMVVHLVVLVVSSLH
jgi:hypothetical protein